jgi:hypothetical protein
MSFRFKGKPMLRAILLVGACAISADAAEWVLGGSGLSWGDVVEVRAQIDDQSSPGSIQIRGFTPDENIITSLNWSYGKPKDLISEGSAALWDNTAFRSPDALNIVDGDGTTSTLDLFKRAGVDQDGRAFILDMGSRVPADSLAFYPRQEGASANGRPFAEEFVRKHTIFSSDGLSYVSGDPLFSLLRDVPVNPNSVFQMKFPQQFIRFIRLRVGSRNPFEIAELELYGNGFVPRATYVSDVVNLGSESNYGSLSWAEQTLQLVDGELVRLEGGGNTSVSVRMKTGLDEGPLLHFKKVIDATTRAVSQVVVTESEYKSLPSGERGDIEEDTENWSAWSLPLVSGQRVPLPSPRPFFQLQIVMESESVAQTMRIDSLVIEHSIPPAAAVVGEISIADDPNPPSNIGVIDKDDAVVLPSIDGGEEVLFAYDIRATILDASENGFDALRIDTPTPAEFVGMLMGEELVPVDPDQVIVSDNAIEIIFSSNKIDFDNSVPLRVLFRGSAVVFGTIFTGTVWDTQSDILGQPVLEGDANFDVSTNSLRVALTQKSIGDIVRGVEFVPPVFTPNGDGINDELSVKYTVIQISEPKPIRIAIYDLSGSLVRTLVDRDQTGGIYTEMWDGKNDAGEAVPPGNYIVFLVVKSGIGNIERVGAIAVAY